jgi:hypothetical protein
MLKDLFEQLTKLFAKEKPITHVVDDDAYAIKPDGTLGDYVRKPLPTPFLEAPVLPLLTLTGFVAAYKANVDQFPAEVAIQVESPTVVKLVALRADEFARRHVWLRAEAMKENPFAFGDYMEPEQFLIALQKGFKPTGNVTAIAAMCSTLTTGNSVGVADDGISQTVTLQEGAIQRGRTTVPNRLPLAPYRTFREIDPIESDFMLRMKAVKDGLPRIALLEVDGGKWKLDTVLAIGAWLAEQLPEATVIA